ncbi:uncharacterized protein LOC125662317 isoform X1 [Ostrea edulis]|uniref:uncharacterized protein LOC125662317 isoform X1 n=1 Tax=Ostrea edulis TaxID=37623 RepID=UPI0024AF4770|nr:uncharacterized protein LOC125662317 isoform X1 [Ostrea edulis]XP_056003106.1 uncharacterized protein LOC125662317 isoform X1 [Ostrea edulis]XP_056003107.1 uncharacterized protein LOC125662317 isoform X1 [Ostrea edulis]XP_056003108.1 uncharacterized protein LOC125662317 isoform X1 [Ostrea edulis]XP_056003109.1 uncharacterized protein LOC125662317 isoform X1 [Ostrea edulis]XP_056003110.1 uncharacterized protein LOC125662317 isoform X1 [Ostrea edulis]
MGVAIHDDGLFLNTVLVPATEQNQISFLSHVIDEFPMALKLKDPEGFSLLHLGAKYALMGMVDFFIGKGFNPNERSYRGETVLHILAMHGSITNVKWFSCRYPQHVTMLTTTGKSVLHYAVSNRDAEVMLYFVRDVKMIPHEETYNKETLLHLACESGNSLLVRHILDLYPEMMNSQDANGCTAFQTACINGDLETVKILCDHREFSLELLSTGENVLGSVCKSKQIDTFTYLLHAFPELLNEESGGGYTLLHIASAFSTVYIVNYLTNHGFNVQRRTTSGRNALHVACSSGNFEVVRFMTWRYPELLKAVDNDGYDAMLCAAESKSMETVKYLIDKGYFRKQTSHSGQNIFHISCRESTVEIVKYLYQNYPQDFVEPDKLGQLPIHFSAMNTCLQVIQFCLSLNVDVYATSLVNRTILHYACSNRNTDVLKYVLKTVPGLRHRRDINGYNAIHCSCETNNKEAFEFLLKEGFEIHSKTFDDFTVLDLAFLHRSMSIVATIMDKYKRGKYDNFMDMISHRIAQYENHILARLKKFEYIDFAVFPLRRVDTKFKYSNVSSLVDLHFTNQEKSVFQKETAVNKTFKRMLALSKIEEEIDMTFQELLIEVGLTQVELWYINLAFLFPEHMPDAWISSFLERIKSCELSSVLKAAAYGICRKFTNAFYRVLSIQSVWAGYTYSTLKGHLNSQLDTIVVITNEENGNVQLKMKEYLGLKLYFRNADKCSHEAKEIMCYENENLSSIHLQQEDIQRLLSSHSNITLISASSVKSKGYGKPYQEPPVKQHTIVIYCRVKGIIPVGEMRFPTEIGGYPVDVRESVVTFAAGHEGVRIGDKIGPTEESITGTLGGFIDLDLGKKGFITCAHVVCSKFLDNQNALQNIAEQNISVGVVEEKGKRRIGKVNKAYFNLDQVTKTSIDAALIELNDSLPETGQFSLKVKTEDYRKAGFQQHHIPSFSNGEISKVPDINLKMFLKIGAVSGLTCGFLHFKDPAAVIGTTPHNVYIHKNKYELHGQIEVKPHRCETFIEKGDSGAFVFSLEMDDAPILRCIGMVEAFTDHGTCLVTPIQDVLSALGLNIYHLTKFEKELQEHDKEDFLSRMFADLRRRMESMQNDMQEMKIKVDTTTESVSKIQTDMSNMQNEMTSVHEKLDLIDKSTLTTSTDDPQM